VRASGRQVSDRELEVALAAGKLQLTRRNARVVRCCLAECRALVPVGTGRRLWLDGFARGFLCLMCQGVSVE
jgi:hypothetical protein